MKTIQGFMSDDGRISSLSAQTIAEYEHRKRVEALSDEVCQYIRQNFGKPDAIVSGADVLSVMIALAEMPTAYKMLRLARKSLRRKVKDLCAQNPF